MNVNYLIIKPCKRVKLKDNIWPSYKELVTLKIKPPTLTDGLR